MPENRIRHRRSGCCWSFSLLFSLVLLIYSNTFQSAWHLDDYQNIVINSRVQIEDLSPQTLYQAIRPPVYNRIWRPVSFLTFALNWYFGQDDPFGYHVVNITIHVLAAFLLFLKDK